ncbi:hypothetical protein [Nonomuraea sp. GTA35]|uniref:hypothetical protein n=1 Tax=Nonomuraea sp. GTA35 TaxID=1676746 RepID=UPI0035C269C4
MSVPTCPECSGWAYSGSQENYDHIHEVKTLSPAKRTDGHIVRRGYAVGMSGPAIDQLWVFFDYIEPALVFGRAGRMSIAEISGYGVYEAAQELRFDRRLRRDVHTLHVLDGDSLDRHTDEAVAFTRWVAGCDPKHSHFQPGHQGGHRS